MKSISGIHYSKSHHKFACNVHTGGKRRFIGYYDSRYAAEQALKAYKNRFKTNEPIDYNLLAHDESAWTEKAHEIIKQLSNRPDAVKVRAS